MNSNVLQFSKHLKNQLEEIRKIGIKQGELVTTIFPPSTSFPKSFGGMRLLQLEQQFNSGKEMTYMSLEHQPTMDECVKFLKETCKEVWSSEVPSYEFCGIVNNWSFTTKRSGESVDDINNNVPLFLKGYTKRHSVFGSNVGIITPQIKHIQRSHTNVIDVVASTPDDDSGTLNVHLQLGSSYIVTTEDNKIYSTAMPDILLRMEIASKYTQREIEEMQPYEYVYDYFNKKLGV